MERDLPIDHILLAPSYLRHIDSHSVRERSEAAGVTNKVGDPRTPQLVLGWEARDGWTRAADPTALDHGNFLAGATEMPGEQFSTLATA